MEKNIYIGIGGFGIKSILKMWRTEILDANSMFVVIDNDEKDLNEVIEPEYHIHKIDLTGYKEINPTEVTVNNANFVRGARSYKYFESNVSDKLSKDLDGLQIENEDKIGIHMFISMMGCTGSGLALPMISWLKKTIAEKAGAEVAVFGYFLLPEMMTEDVGDDIAILRNDTRNALTSIGEEIQNNTNLFDCIFFEKCGDREEEEYIGVNNLVKLSVSFVENMPKVQAPEEQFCLINSLASSYCDQA